MLLQSADNVNQNAGIITANGILLGGGAGLDGGNFTLGNDNSVNQIAANIEGSLLFDNSRSLEIASLTYDSSCGTMESITG